VNYLGIDQYAPFLEEGSKRFADTPDTTFMYGDFISVGLPAVDYVFASGSLSYRSDEPRFIHDAIAKLFGICQRGFAFNLLSEVDETDNVLCAHDPLKILNICGQWTDQVELREVNYGIRWVHGNRTGALPPRGSQNSLSNRAADGSDQVNHAIPMRIAGDMRRK